MAYSAFQKAVEAEEPGWKRDSALRVWQMINVKCYDELGKRPTKQELDAEVERLFGKVERNA
jgi:hypothetical protein